MRFYKKHAGYWLVLFLCFSLITGCSEPSGEQLGSPDNIDPEYIAGETYYGRNSYTEYRPGNLPIIIGAPHGGSEKPEEIPDRTWGTTGKDSYTLELSRTFADSLKATTGKLPHLIICHLHRTKLDANRDVNEAAQGNSHAGSAWSEYHGYIDAAKKTITEEYGQGLYIDLHGQSRRPRIELGYLLDAENYVLPDSALNNELYINKSSIKALAQFATADFATIVRGENSIGSMLFAYDYPVVPCVEISDPGTEGYFRGGYSTIRHGSRDGGTISALQIELYKEGIRDTAENRARFSGICSRAIVLFFKEYYGLDLITS